MRRKWQQKPGVFCYPRAEDNLTVQCPLFAKTLTWPISHYEKWLIGEACHFGWQRTMWESTVQHVAAGLGRQWVTGGVGRITHSKALFNSSYCAQAWKKHITGNVLLVLWAKFLITFSPFSAFSKYLSSQLKR